MTDISKKINDGWIYTYSGKKFNVFNPDKESIDIEDIAHALSLNCRFNGHIHTHYSVAQHSVYVASLVSDKYKLEALLHDAAEAYLTDIPRPIKKFLPESQKVEDDVTKIIFEKYGCEYPIPKEVKDIDHSIVADEAAALWKTAPEWTNDFNKIGVHIVPYDWNIVKKLFLEMFYSYKEQRR